MQSVNLIRNPRPRLVLAALVLCSPAIAQVNIDAYRDYFLVGRFGEVCTMCEVTVLCEATDALPEYSEVPVDGTFTLYHLQTRTFWSQISTIWEWFISNFSAAPLAARGHTRPVRIYAVVDGEWQPRELVEARLVLDPGVLEFGDTHINRVNRQWLDAATQQPIGYCQRLPLWNALDAIAQRSVEGASR
jgi:hypothetical protein